ncbi:MAG: FHA domain-containing protein [Gammaproteobacteria bacterium]
MDKPDQDAGDDDGIVAEDVTQLFEHIELTGPQRLPDAPDWEMATPAAELDEAPILIDDGGTGIPDLDAAHATAEDLELFTETQYDVGRHLPVGNHPADAAAEHAAERLRWQQRVEGLLMSLAERDELLAEREKRIEELTAKIATMTLERASLAEELHDVGEATESPVVAAKSALEVVLEPAAAPIPADTTAELPAARESRADTTAELPAIGEPRKTVAAAPAMRRYLIGLDLVGVAHEIVRPRINIGRTHDNDLRILEPTVSRLHAMLTVRGGEAMIVDANSRNGVFVNGIQVRYAKLEDGDVVTFGTVRFRYRIGGSAAGSAYGAS